jgi:hypothetical protein
VQQAGQPISTELISPEHEATARRDIRVIPELVFVSSRRDELRGCSGKSDQQHEG